MGDDFYIELQSSFYKESLALVEIFEFIVLHTTNPSKAELNELIRVAHNIKGGAAVVGLAEVSSYVLKIEFFLGQFEKNLFVYTVRATYILLEFVKIIKTEFIAQLTGLGNLWNIDKSLIDITEYNLNKN